MVMMRDGDHNDNDQLIVMHTIPFMIENVNDNRRRKKWLKMVIISYDRIW